MTHSNVTEKREMFLRKVENYPITFSLFLLIKNIRMNCKRKGVAEQCVWCAHLYEH